MKKKVKNYQRQFIVNYNLQLTILLYSMLLAAWVSLSNILLRVLISGRLGFLSKLNLYLTVPFVLFIIFSITVVFGLILTNRIAGPIYRLKKHMDDVAEGKPFEELKLRKADYFSELAVPYNKILRRLNGEGQHERKK